MNLNLLKALFTRSTSCIQSSPVKLSYSFLFLLLLNGVFARVAMAAPPSSSTVVVTASKTFALADRQDVIELNIRARQRHHTFYVSSPNIGVQLNDSTIRTDRFGNARLLVRSRSAGVKTIWISRHRRVGIKVPRGLVGGIKLTFYRPLRLISDDFLYQGECIPISAVGGVPAYSFQTESIGATRFYFSENKICESYQGSPMSESVTVTLRDSIGNEVKKTIKVVPNFHLNYGTRFLVNQCTVLSASGGVPATESPAYQFSLMSDTGVETPLEDGRFCPTHLGTYTIITRDSLNKTIRTFVEVLNPLKLLTPALFQGCNGLRAEGGRALETYPFYDFYQILPDGSLEYLPAGGICVDTIGSTVKIQVNDALGNFVRKDLFVFSPPPRQIYLAEIEKTDLYNGECTSFAVEGNRGMVVRQVKDATGGYWNYEDGDPRDTRYSGRYCAGTGPGKIEIIFYDDDNAGDFVLTLNVLGRAPVSVYVTYSQISENTCTDIYLSGGSEENTLRVIPTDDPLQALEVTLTQNGSDYRLCGDPQITATHSVVLEASDPQTGTQVLYGILVSKP